MSSAPTSRAARAEPVPTRRPARGRRGGRGGQGRPVPQYLLGAAVGFVAGPLVAGALWMIVLFYASWLGDFDTKNDRFSEVAAATVLIAPFLGVLAGVGFVAWRRRRARARRRS